MSGFGAAILSGILLYLASPGAAGEGLLAWFALTPLLLALATAPPGRAALLGLTCGLVYHLPLLRWITIVLGEHGGVHPLAAHAALFLLALYMALYPALFAALTTSWRGRVPLLWSAPVIWVGLDFCRAWLLTGFPWQDLGYSQYRFPILIQVTDLVGHHGITFLLLLSNGLLAALILKLRQYATAKAGPRPTGAPAGLPAWPTLLAAALLPMLAVAYGAVRLPAIEARQASAATLAVAVIQGNIPQDDKWAPAYQRATVARYLELSAAALAAEPRPELLIWPETALPFYPLEHHLFSPVAGFANRHRLALLTGAPHRQPRPGAEERYYNSAFLVGPTGRVDGIYHKQHLVPFGEYIPLRRLLPFFAPIVETLGDFTPGPGPQLLSIARTETSPAATVGALICFEAIFPGLARRMTAAGADLLVNITNDAWFGRSHAPYQHLSMAALRAVENRRGLARSANTGISAFVLPSGRLSTTTDLFVPAHRTALLPLLTETTFFSRGGHWFAPLCLGLVIIGGLIHLYGIINGYKKDHKTRPTTAP